MTKEGSSGGGTTAQLDQLLNKLCQTCFDLQTKINQLQWDQDEEEHKVVKKLKADHGFIFQQKGAKPIREQTCDC